MPDRETIKSGFRLCANGKPCMGEKYTSCPFSPRHNAERNCGVTMARIALSLLKEQEAVEPNVSSAEQRCGNCNKVIEMDGWKACPWCGKMIDWKRWWNKNGTHDNT